MGLVLVISALIWLATRPSLSPIARMPHIPNSAPARESFVPPKDQVVNETHTDDNQSPAIIQRPDLTDSKEGVPGTAKYEQTEKIKPQKFHIVSKGETLSTISVKYYGSAGKWQKIFDANKGIIKDPNKLIPGTKLIIPD